MQLGIFAKTFSRPTLDEVFGAAKACGVDCVQFNLSCAGLPTVPESVPARISGEVASQLRKTGLSMAAISGTCNLIHPDLVKRAHDVANLQKLIAATPRLGTNIVTLCTGSRDSSDMWRAHPANGSAEAWLDLVRSLEQLLPVAEAQSVVLGIEPEPANVINSALKARQLLDQMRSPSLKIVFDAANLLNPDTLGRQQHILREAFELLGKDIVLAHAKDLRAGPGAEQVAPGRGDVDYPAYLALLKQSGFGGALVLHNLLENEASTCVAFLQRELAAAD